MFFQFSNSKGYPKFERVDMDFIRIVLKYTGQPLTKYQLHGAPTGAPRHVMCVSQKD